VPYRLDIPNASTETFERLVELGALDAELAGTNAMAALMPDAVSLEQVVLALRTDAVTMSPAIGRDSHSVWLLTPRPVAIGRLRIIPAGTTPAADTIAVIDSGAFGTGFHPTTALCVETVIDAVTVLRPPSILDVGTGSGILALAALKLGVPRAVGLDTDGESLRAAAANADANDLTHGLRLIQGGPDAVRGAWTLVLANIVASPLIELAPTMVRRVGHHGWLVLSGISTSVQLDVENAYRRLGMRRIGSGIARRVDRTHPPGVLVRCAQRVPSVLTSLLYTPPISSGVGQRDTN
jgi:ribosomal protein L11 methyltransferase